MIDGDFGESVIRPRSPVPVYTAGFLFRNRAHSQAENFPFFLQLESTSLVRFSDCNETVSGWKKLFKLTVCNFSNFETEFSLTGFFDP